jgi:MtN3 and saliva related transmembrane protein
MEMVPACDRGQPGGRAPMVLDPLTSLGFVASAFTASSFAPQVWHTWRSRDVSGISLLSYSIITFGLGLWLVYGLLRGDVPLIVANAVMVALTLAIVVMKMTFGSSKTSL